MKQLLNSKLKGALALLSAVVLIFSLSAPSVSAGVKESAIKEKNVLSKEEMDQIINETVSEIKADARNILLSERVSSVKNGQVTINGGGTLAVKLAKLFGKSYVKSKLPKKIYKAFPKSLKKNVSESKWVGIWNTYILMGPLDEVKTSVADALKPYVWDWVATTCGYIAQGIVYAVI